MYHNTQSQGNPLTPTDLKHIRTLRNQRKIVNNIERDRDNDREHENSQQAINLILHKEEARKEQLRQEATRKSKRAYHAVIEKQ